MDIERQVLHPDRLAHQQRIRQIVFREQQIKPPRNGPLGRVGGR